MKNLSISTKLFFGFAFLIAIAAIIAFIASQGKASMQNEANYVLEGPNARLIIIREIELEMMNARRIMNRISMYGATNVIDQAGIDGQRQLFETSRSNVINLIAQYRYSMDNVNTSTQSEIAARHLIINEMVSHMEAYWDAIEQVITLSRAGNIYGAIELTRAAGAIVAAYTAPMYALIDTSVEFMDASSQMLKDYADSQIFLMWAVAIAGGIIAIIVSVAIIRSIQNPVREISKIVSDVSKGHVNINMKPDLPTNELGLLTKDIYGLVDVIRSMVDDLTQLDHNYVALGDIDYRIDTEKYQNTFKDMMVGINNIPDAILKDIMMIINSMQEINKGNFNPKVDTLVGKKIVLTNTVLETLANLKGVSTEIQAMVEAAAVKGDLHFQIDITKYEGDWRNIMNGLNDVALAVDAPIVEISNVMAGLSRGDFSKNVSGDYTGDFLSIKQAVNLTIETLASYIAEISDSLQKVSDGDLTNSITREYIGNFVEIKSSINNISKTLNNTMSDISAAADQVLSGATQISTSASDLANGSQEQASSIEELNTSIDVVSQQTKQNAIDAAEANALSGKSADSAKEGSEAMGQMLNAMSAIKESSDNISGIIKTIEDIAFQTNLLALNASVEAARAGEHGRGFAVVAEEVRSLAGRSQAAASETTGLIGDSIQRVGSGSAIAGTTSESLSNIVESINNVLGIIAGIAASSKEQSEAIEHISDGIASISKVVQNNSAVSQETAAASEELSSQAQLLQSLVSYFKTTSK